MVYYLSLIKYFPSVMLSRGGISYFWDTWRCRKLTVPVLGVQIQYYIIAVMTVFLKNWMTLKEPPSPKYSEFLSLAQPMLYSQSQCCTAYRSFSGHTSSLLCAEPLFILSKKYMYSIVHFFLVYLFSFSQGMTKQLKT